MSTIRRSRPKPAPRSTSGPRVFALLVLLRSLPRDVVRSEPASRAGPVSLRLLHQAKRRNVTGGVARLDAPAQAGETDAEHLHNTVLYAACRPLRARRATSPRFASRGTHVQAVSVTGSTATVDLSKDVAQQVAGTFGENGEFKSLVYTVTGVPASTPCR